LQIYPRVGADPGVSLGVAALSSMFWKRDADTPDAAGDEAHDADQLFVKSADGTETTTPLENPKLSKASDPWQRRTFAGPFDTISLLQTERDPQKYAAYESARYADRPSYAIGEITASVPLSAELAIVHASDEYIDNVVLDLVADTNGAAVPIEVSYVLSAEDN
jgi:glucan biosynthesis protein